MVGGDVGDDGDVVAVVAQALAQDAAARDLEHRGVHGRVLEDHLRRLRARHVAALDQPPVDDDAVRRGHADAPAHQLEDVRDHPDGGRLAVGAGHRDDRDAGRRAGREQQVDDRLGDVLRLALGRVGVHPEAGRRVDLDDAAAGLAHRLGDVGADEVDAGDVEADDARRRLRDLDVVGVGLDRPVDGRAAGRHVAGERELDQAPLAGTSSGAKPWPARSSSALASSLIRVSTFSWPMPRRGSWLAMSTSSRTVCSPSPSTLAPGRARRPRRACRR